MINDISNITKINKLKEKLNYLITQDVSYQKILDVSREIDKLLIKYYNIDFIKHNLILGKKQNTQYN